MGTLQIVLTIVMYIAFQLIPRLISEDDTRAHFDITQYRGIEILPPYWFAVGTKTLGTLVGTWKDWCFLLLGILSPFIILWYMVRYLAPAFNEKIVEINNGGSLETKKISSAKSGKVRRTYGQLLGNLFAQKGAERSGFLLTWNVSARSKDFKMKVYPFIGYVVTYVLIFTIFRKHKITFAELQSQTNEAVIIFLSLMYSIGMVLFTAFTQMSFSEKYKASWIYYTTPIKYPGKIILGAAKALLLKFIPPFILIISAIVIYLWGMKVIPNLLLGISNVILMGLLTIKIGKYIRLPFSTFEGNESKAGDVIKNIFRILIILLLGVGHYFIYWNFWAVLIALCLSIAAVWYIGLSIRDTVWDKIDVENVP